MTKELFEQYDGLLFCKTCGREFPKIHINHKRVYPDGSVTRCGVCDWIKRNQHKMNIENFSEEEIVEFLHFLFYDESYYLNDIADRLNRSLDDIFELYQALKVRNKTVKIRAICEYCGKEFDCVPSRYKLNKHLYCSHECYFSDKPNKMKKGSESIYYNRIKTTCTNCGKEIEVIPYSYNMKNKFGDNHNFCSQECYWEYRSKYYRGDKHTKRREPTQEERDKMRQVCINNNKHMSSKNTSIQLLVNQMLDELEIQYEREFATKYYSIDNYLIDHKLAIEVMGDYWHANPIVYNQEGRSIDSVQYKDIVRDKSKKTYIKKYMDIDILYLWEKDINNSYDLCKSLIKLYIDNDGELPNYNSFNWYLTKSYELQINDTIIYPYFELDIKYTNKILKKEG